MKIFRAIFFSLGILLGLPADSLAGRIANVEYAHRYVEAKTGVHVPIAASNARQAVNAEYVLYLVDIVNKHLTGTTTSYHDSKYATKRVADVDYVAQVMSNLIASGEVVEPPTPPIPHPLICEAGQYVPADTAVCAPCPNGSYCPGGQFMPFAPHDDLGITACPAGATGSDTPRGEIANCYKEAQTSISGGTVTKRCYYGTIEYTENCQIKEESILCDSGYEVSSDGLGCMVPVPEVPEAPAFSVTLTGMSAGEKFSFQISANGTFYVDWGDNSAVEAIVREGAISYGASADLYSHTYATAGNYTVKLTGLAEGYSHETTTAVGGSFDTTAAITFQYSANKTKMTAISGDLGAIFPILESPAAGTFYTPRFYNTFSGCTGLKGIPPDLFAGLNGNTKPKGWANGLTGKRMFEGTFLGCSGLTGPIPPNLFASVSGAPSMNMFHNTFAGCSKLSGSIPENLFASFSGAADSAFGNTFEGCSGLTGSIPENLFGNISGGKVGSWGFYRMFKGCSGLTGPIPGNLFAGFSSGGTFSTFEETFSGCSGLTGEIPGNLFGSIKSAPVSNIFGGTFEGCNKLTSIGDGLFDGISGGLASGAFANTFKGCTNLTGPSATTKGSNDIRMPIYDKWPDATTEQVGGCYAGATKLSDFSNTPKVWGGSFVAEEAPEFPAEAFKITLSNMTANGNFSFQISASGSFMIDWGDGSAAQAINKTDTTLAAYTHGYAASGTYTVTLTGKATGYSVVLSNAAISFANSTNKTKMTSVTGDLGKIFPILNASDTGTPRFYETFFGCTGLASIPGSLFSGLDGAPVKNMFAGTFQGCTGLTGTIPGTLFSGIIGAPAESMFSATFQGCSNLTGQIPGTLFSGISGAPAPQMFVFTFSGCSGLTSIGAGLFDGIAPGSIADLMFGGTFYNCAGLKGPSATSGDASGNNRMPIFGKWPDTAGNQGAGCYTGATGLDDYCEVPVAWGGDAKVECKEVIEEPEEDAFYVKLSGMTINSEFSFQLTAQGIFYVDWGDNTPVQTIIRMEAPSTSEIANPTAYSHKYATSGNYTVKFTGKATGYNGYVSMSGNPVVYTPSTTISFANSPNKAKMTSIAGNLGAIFPILSATQAPRFYKTFSGCSNITGPIPSSLFSGLEGAPIWGMFYGTFEGCTGLTGPIPGDLFSGIIGAPAGYMFNGTFKGCTKLTGIGNGLFSGISGKPASYMFANTFSGCSGLAGSIQSGMLGNISGAPVEGMFQGTFQSCSKLTGSIPSNMFSGISGTPATYMFASTFSGCSGLTGSIPGTLFSGISGAPISSMFQGTFSGCNKLTGEIPANLFSGINGSPAASMFASTFSGCNKLTGSIPGTLFSGIKGAPSANMFTGTFRDCSSLTGSIPANLFSGISGAPATYMFSQTFYGCSKLTGPIPGTLFGGLDGAPANGIFNYTFYGCSGLNGSIPANLFSGVKGKSVGFMFHSTFYGCKGLTGIIPGNLFSGLNGSAQGSMFHSTFRDCSGLTGIGNGLFESVAASLGLAGTGQMSAFLFTFSGCTGLTGPSATGIDVRGNKVPFYKAFTGATPGKDHFEGHYRNATGLSDYDSIPASWK